MISKTSNKPFTDKVEDYFDKKKNDFVLVDDLKEYDDWNIENLKNRHNELINDYTNLWLKN